jgi:hypothetical protein
MAPARCHAVERAWSPQQGSEGRTAAKAGHARSWRNRRPPMCRGKSQESRTWRLEGFQSPDSEIWLVCEAGCYPLISSASPRTNLLAGANRLVEG